MKKILPILLFTLLASCSTENVNSGVNSSQPSASSTLLSSNRPSTTATSSMSTSTPIATSNPTSSVASSSQLVTTSSSPTSTTSSSPAALSNIWLAAMGNVTPSEFYGVTETLPTTLSSKDVVVVLRVYRQDGTLYGYAYEALVDGNGGDNTNRFRVGLVNNQFSGFQSVNHREHAGIGIVIIQALAARLAGTPATFDAALQIMLNANATLTGFTASITVDGIRPALEAIVTHYLSKI